MALTTPNRLTAVPPAVRLAGIGALMAALFYLVFGGRYSLFVQGPLAQQSLATINQNSLDSALWYIATFAVLFGLYALGYHWLKRQVGARLWLVIGGGALLLNIVLLPMLPFDAADIYDYIIRGRMTTFYGLNPMHDTPSQVPDDIAYPYAAWHDIGSSYGPLWETVASGLARLAGDNLVTNVLVFKTVAALAELLTALLIGLTLRRIAPERALLGVYLFAWNPIVPFFAAGNGHNDFLMIALMLLSVYYLMQRWYSGAALAAVCGALVKFIPVLLLPFIVIVAWRELRGAARLRSLAAMFILSGLTVVVFYGRYGIGLDTLALDRRGHMFTGTVGTLIRQLLEPFIGTDPSATLVSMAFWLLFGVIGLVVLIRFWRQSHTAANTEPLQPIRLALLLLLVYVLLIVTWFQGWYVLWPLSLAVLLPDTPLRRLTLLFTWLVTWQALLYNYVSLRYDGWLPLPWRDLIPVAAVMGTAWLFTAWLFWRQRQQRPTVTS